MNPASDSIEWSESFECLGIYFHVGLKLEMHIDMIKLKFFVASNSAIW